MSWRQLMQDIEEASKAPYVEVEVSKEKDSLDDIIVEYDDQGNEYLFIKKVK